MSLSVPYLLIAVALAAVTFMNCRRNPEVSSGTMFGGLGFGAFGAAIYAVGSRDSVPFSEFILFYANGVSYATFAYSIGVGLFAGAIAERVGRVCRAA